MLAVLSACGDNSNAPGLTGDNACDTLAILQTRCGSCHSDAQTETIPLGSLQYLRTGSSVYPSQSTASRVIERITNVQSPMPPVGHDRVPEAEIAVIRSWIEADFPVCATDDGGDPEPSPNLIPQDQLFACNGAPGGSPARIRRLDKNQFRYSIPSRIGTYGLSNWAAFNPLDPNANDEFSTFASDETIDDTTLDLLLQPGLLGDRVGRDMVTYLHDFSVVIGGDRRLLCIWDQQRPDSQCISTFAGILLERLVLFRPARTDETARLAAFASAALSKENGFSIEFRDATLANVSNTAWLMTGALFHSEIGDRQDGTRRRLSNWELAEAVAQLLSFGPAGAPRQVLSLGYDVGIAGYFPDIVAAAKDGTIQDPTVIRSIIRAHAFGFDPERNDLDPDSGAVANRVTHGEYWAARKISSFFRDWLDYGKFPTVFKEQPGKTSQFQPSGDLPVTSGINSSYLQLQNGLYGIARPSDPPGVNFRESVMVEQLDDTIARVVAGDQNVLHNLLTTTQFHVSATWRFANLMAHLSDTQRPYNIVEDVPDTRGGRWVSLPANERAGVLTHPAWLAAHGGNFEDDPSIVQRGKWIREHLLCQYVPPLSQVKVAAIVGPSSPTKSARNRLDDATSSPACQACHRLMNPLGYPFEMYNHAGFLRSVDHAGAVTSSPDGSAVLTDMPDPSLNGPVTNAIDLNNKLANSPYVKRCFIRQTFRYFMGRNETRADACSLSQMETAYDAPGATQGSMVTLLQALATSDAFLYRKAVGN
jgi:Protein of unknown function (DUF1588)/Protein of unknown function (DUF1585)